MLMGGPMINIHIDRRSGMCVCVCCIYVCACASDEYIYVWVDQKDPGTTTPAATDDEKREKNI